MPESPEKPKISSGVEEKIEAEKSLEKERVFKDVEMKVEVTNVCSDGRCRFCSPMFRPTVREAGAQEILRGCCRLKEGVLKKG